MACDTIRIPNMTPPQRKKQIADAVDQLNKALARGEVSVKVGPQGAVTFTGNVAGILGSNKISDTCAYRKLVAMGSPSLQMAIQKAEMLAGRKVDPKAVASGTHSHDGGSTWSKGH